MKRDLYKDIRKETIKETYKRCILEESDSSSSLSIVSGNMGDGARKETLKKETHKETYKRDLYMRT